MKKAIYSLFFALFAFGGAHANLHMEIYYFEGCTFGGWAKDFVKETLVYEYPMLYLTEIDVSAPENQGKHPEAVEKCKVGGGVPLTVINDTKCIYGFGPIDSSQKEFRDALDAMLTEDEKEIVVANRKEMAVDADAFRAKADAHRATMVQTVLQAQKDYRKRMLCCHTTGIGSIIILVGALVLLNRRKKPCK